MSAEDPHKRMEENLSRLKAAGRKLQDEQKPLERTYRGIGGSHIVLVCKPLEHIVRHSPSGFSWGFGGSGPADLAYSILHDLYGHPIAEQYYQLFKWTFIAKLPQGEEWTLTSTKIERWLRNLEGEVPE